MEVSVFGRVCKSCNKYLNLSEFDKHEHGKFGVRATCKSCQSIYAKKYRDKNPDLLKYLKEKYRDSFDGFITRCLGDARRRAQKKHLSYELTFEFVKTLWENQNNNCAFTGIPLEYKRLPDKNKNPYQASLDRIDSSIGYVHGNVRWVCWFVNQMKSDFSDEKLKHFCSLISNSPKT